jgi:hypothetical protein
MTWAKQAKPRTDRSKNVQINELFIIPKDQHHDWWFVIRRFEKSRELEPGGLCREMGLVTL